jgi:hypothetical protein
MTVRRILVRLTIAGALVFTACGGSDEVADDTPAAGSATAGSTTSETTTTTEAVPPTEGSQATDPAGTEPPGIGLPPDPPATEPAGDLDGSCLVGEWVVGEEAMNAFYAGVTATLSTPVTITVEGFAPITFQADHTYAWALAFTLTVEVLGQVGTGASGGSIVGDWSAADGVLTTSAEVNEIEVDVAVAGVTLDESDFANGLLDGSPVNGVSYSCVGPTPVLDFQTADPDVTVPVALEPA